MTDPGLEGRPSTCRRLGSIAPGLLALALLAACTAEPENEVEMSHACQLTACICQSSETPFYEATTTAEVLWRDNGDAYCPDGYALQPAE